MKGSGSIYRWPILLELRFKRAHLVRGFIQYNFPPLYQRFLLI
jgi:hypothetical protein